MYELENIASPVPSYEKAKKISKTQAKTRFHAV